MDVYVKVIVEKGKHTSVIELNRVKSHRLDSKVAPK